MGKPDTREQDTSETRCYEPVTTEAAVAEKSGLDMLSRTATALRGTCRMMRPSTSKRFQAQRHMAGGHWMEVSKVHTLWGEAFGVVCWLWIFHRARNDLPVVLGWRHPWEHAPDPWASHVHINEKVLAEDWDTFGRASAIQGEDDDDEDDEEEEEEDNDDNDDDDE